MGLPATTVERAHHQMTKETSSLKNLLERREEFDFGLGLLSFEAVKAFHADKSTPGSAEQGTQLKLVFVPPSWMSQTALQVAIDLPCETSPWSSGPMASLHPTTINQSGELLKAVHSFDLVQLRHLFETKQARPTDMVMDLDLNEPVPLSEVMFSVNKIVSGFHS